MNLEFSKAKNEIGLGNLDEAIKVYQNIQNKYPELARFAIYNIEYFKKINPSSEYIKNSLENQKNINFFDIKKNGESFFDRVRREIESNKYEIISIDFFDTLVFRATEDPTDIFLLMGKKLRALNLDSFLTTPEEFKALRIVAEQQARKKSLFGPEVSLKEIYECFKSTSPSLDPEYLESLEYQTEKENIYPVKSSFALIDLAKKNGKKVIVTSDTYYSQSELLGLIPPNYSSSIDFIFTSSDLRAGKSTGSYEKILHKLKIEPSQLLHCGDNYEADVVLPRKLGISTFLLPNATKELINIRKKELEFYRYRSQHHSPILMGNLSTLDLKSSHFLNPDKSLDHFAYGFYILGPILISFVDWVLQRLKLSEAQFIFPLMREGHLLGEIIKILDPNGLNVVPLYFNRKILRKASIRELGAKEISFAFNNQMSNSLVSSLSLINLTLEDFSYDFQEAFKLNKNLALAELLRSSNLREKCTQRAEKLRSKVLKHLKLQLKGGPIPKKICLMDLGWNTTIQSLLLDLFKISGIDIEVSGYYLMTTSAAADLNKSNKASANGYLLQSGYPLNDFDLLIRNVEILEQSCIPAHGTVIEYEDDGRPIFSEIDSTHPKWKQLSLLQDGIKGYANFYNANRELININDEKHKEYLKCKLARAMHAPIMGEIDLFKSWSHDDNLFENPDQSLATKLKLKSGELSLDSAINLPMSEIYWSGGALGTMDHSLAELSLYLRSIPVSISKLFFKP